MKILVTGSSGLVGRALVPRLEKEGHEVLRLVRRAPAAASERRWDPAKGEIDASALEVDAVVHLAGEGIAEGRWNKARKQRIRDSRVDGTSLLARAIADVPADKRPRALVCASAIGFYGDRGDDEMTEGKPAGTSFLSKVCQEWEAASAPAEKAGVRVVKLRLGVVLSPDGGALKKMLPPFKMGVAGNLGDGKQWMSWIALTDVVGMICHALTTDELSGPVNAVAPGAVTNAQFTKSLGRVLKRPTLFPMPSIAAKLVFGEMADELLLASTRVKPAAAVESGYGFDQPEIEPALRSMLN